MVNETRADHHIKILELAETVGRIPEPGHRTKRSTANSEIEGNITSDSNTLGEGTPIDQGGD